MYRLEAAPDPISAPLTCRTVDVRPVSPSEALELVNRAESHFWEQKSVRTAGASLQKIGCALANADGGEFIVGLDDRRTRACTITDLIQSGDGTQRFHRETASY